ncbi:MAG: acyltransferase [Burkholderiaceae bacterium]
MNQPHARMLYGVQFLRFIAAMMVLIAQATLMVGDQLAHSGGGHWGMGRAGVDIFFVISGFVMAVSSEKLVDRSGGWCIFAVRRLIRLVPMYWLATLAMLLVSIALPSAGSHALPDFGYVAASLLFLPGHDADGQLQPLLAAGWTLNLQMFFYGTFALSLLLRQPALRFCGLAFAALAALSLVRVPNGSALLFYQDPLLIEFAFGMLVARVWRSGLGVRPWLAATLVTTGFLLLQQLEPIAFSQAYALSPRFLAWGLPAMMIVLGTVFLEPALSPHLKATARRLGDASYAIYLLHGLLISLIVASMARLGLIWPTTAVAVSMAAAMIAASYIFRRIEAPLTRSLRGWLTPAPPMDPIGEDRIVQRRKYLHVD